MHHNLVWTSLPLESADSVWFPKRWQIRSCHLLSRVGEILFKQAYEPCRHIGLSAKLHQSLSPDFVKNCSRDSFQSTVLTIYCGKARGKRKEEHYLVDFPPQREWCAVSSGITTIPSTRESEFSKNVCFHFWTVSVFSRSPYSPACLPVSLCLCCRQLNETENKQDTACIYMSREVHQEFRHSFSKSGLEERGQESDREGGMGDDSHDLKQQYKTWQQI